MTTDDKYSLFNSKNLVQPSQMQLYKKQKTISLSFAPFVKSTSNFEHLEAKDDPPSLFILDTRTAKNVVS